MDDEIDDETDDETGSEMDEMDDEVDDDTEDDQVFILSGGVARFVPQWDEQVLGPASTIGIHKDYDNPPPPNTPEQLRFHYCGNCQLTWLVGRDGLDAATSHPSHHTLYHTYTGTSRSLIAFIDGACPSNGPDASKAAIGVYFGPQSTNNISQALVTGRPTNQLAEITAAVEAMRRVRIAIVPRRRILLGAASQQSSRHAMQAARYIRLILATDSSYLVECVCQHMQKWFFDKPSGLYKNRRNQVIANSEAFRELVDEVRLLSTVGVQVMWYKVPRNFNAEADALANAALRMAAAPAEAPTNAPNA
jgi:ribonuclease HI